MGDASTSAVDDPKTTVSVPGPSSVQVFTHNITRRPIAWNPTLQRPTQELVHSIHSALHFALDPCVNHPDEQPSFSVVDLPSPSSASSPLPTGTNPTIAKRLYVPSLDDMIRSRPKPSASKDKDELTVKLFAGFDGATLTPDVITDAIDALESLCGPDRVIDRFIVSLEGVKWPAAASGSGLGSASATTENPEPTTEELRQIEGMGRAWQLLSAHPQIHELGVSDFSTAHLQRLQEAQTVSGCSSKAPMRLVPLTASGHTSSSVMLSNSGIKPARYNQVVFEDDLPPSLVSYADQNAISLVSHSDELGTQRQFVNLLLEFKNTIPIPDKMKSGDFKDVSEVFKMKWVLKYTLFLPERGLVADKGYVIAADFPSVSPAP